MDSGQKELKEKRCFKAADIQDSQKELFFLKFSHLEFFIQQVLIQGTPKYIIGSMIVSQHANILFCM